MFVARKQGYSGVATFTRVGTACPVAAEEGVTGTWSVQSAAPSPSSLSQSSSSAPPTAASIGHNSALLSYMSAAELRDLDSEGRCVITDHGAFLLFNLYVPNAGEERNDFKLRFLELLSMRIRQCQAEGREVVVVGDINIAATRLDHCAPEPFELDDGSKVSFEQSPSRQWWMKHVTDTRDAAVVDAQTTTATSQQTRLVDVLRAEFPRQRNAYTCWNTITGARGGNYGTRIDYILASLNVAAVTHSPRILAHVQGSDHCPVQCDVDVQRLAGWRVGSVPPPLCSQWWPELSGQQKKLSSFFTKLDASSAEQQQSPPSDCDEVAVTGTVKQPATTKNKSVHIQPKRLADEALRAAAGRKKRKLPGADNAHCVPTGSSLLSYFSVPARPSPPTPLAAAVDIDAAFLTDRTEGQQKPTSTISAPLPVASQSSGTELSLHSVRMLDSDEVVDVEDVTPLSPSASPSPTSPPSHSSLHPHSHSASTSHPSSQQMSPPGLSSLSPTAHSPSTPPTAASGQSPPSAVSSFSRLFTQCSLTVLCDHSLPAKMWQVNKKGPNHGRQFYCCSLPPPGRCKFWGWLSDIKRKRNREQSQQGGSPQQLPGSPTREFVSARSMQPQATSG